MAAVVLWLQDRYADVLLQAGVVAALPYLKQLIACGKETRSEAAALAERMVGAWQADSRRWNYHATGGRPEASHRIEMMAALGNLSSASLLERFTADTITPSYDGTEDEALSQIGDELLRA